MGFEWDDEKRIANIEKHEVDFTRAARIFSNPVLQRLDDREDYGENRFIALGHWNEYYLVVVYTWRGENRRIISARRAANNEKRKYRQLFNG